MELLKKYKTAFSPELGTMMEDKNHTFRDAKHTLFKPRSIPFALKEGVECDIHRIVAVGVLEPVDTNTN